MWKSYTMREMKTIVDYLVEHKFYGEIKGRKMWMDFANSQHTARSWQSLKETFLKRILPDIHNPYFKLTTEQINSFRAGYDVVDKNKGKLEIHTISDDDSSNGNNTKDNEHSNGNRNEGEGTAGENIQCSKIPSQSRSSADTVILENCYENAEAILKDLESNGDKESEVKATTMSKSLRDCITYSEPLTPMLQEVLDDFASEPEDSDRETPLEIVENVPVNDTSEDNQTTDPKDDTSKVKNVPDIAKNAEGLSAAVVEEVLAQELDSSSKHDNKSPNKETQDSNVETEEPPVINLDLEDEVSSMQAEKGTEVDNNASETTKVITSETTVPKDSENTEIANKSHPESTQSSGHNNSNTTVDASLPNNPEALKNKTPSININNKTPESAVEVSNTSAKTPSPLKPSARKRSYSEDTLKSKENKKKKFELKLTSSKIKNSTESLPVKHDKKEIKFDEKLKPNEDTDNPMTKEKPEIEKKAIEFVKPTSTLDNEVVDKILLTSDTDKSCKNSPKIKNPCLQNVSLFDEQFNKTKYNMSESSDTEQNKKETTVEKTKQEGTAPPKGLSDTVLLKSHSESDTEVKSPQKKKQRAGVLSTKSERDRAISNMFGFTSGGVGSKRRRQLSRRRRTISQNTVSHSQHNTAPTNSSEWTSESDSDAFVSPPRSRKNRTTRKYLKPKSARILSLEEEGGLFVMYGKKIYPLVKDGKIVKNYLTYLPESDSDEGQTYWKEKYVEEKKKAEELKKLLKKAEEPRRSRDSKSPILQPTPLRNTKSSRYPHELASASHDSGKEICEPGRVNKIEESKVNPPEKITIKFTKNNEEVHLEGHWPQIHPVLEQVVHIFHKESETVSESKSKVIVEHPVETVSESKSKMIVEQPVQFKDPSSGGSTPIIITPVDPEIHEKVNKIEKEIFQEIEERDRAEEHKPNGPEQESNVTKRKLGRPRKSSTAPPSPVKQATPAKQLQIKESEHNTRGSKQNGIETENLTEKKDDASKRPTRTLRKVLNESVGSNETTTVQTRRTKHKLDTSKTDEANADEEVRYMFPPRSKRLSTKSPPTKKANQKPQKSVKKIPKIFSSPDNISLNSMDSTQGYQDSDVSPIKTELRKKKKLNMSTFSIKTRNSVRRSSRRRSYPYLHCDAYNDSSNSSVDDPVHVMVRENSSLNTEAYRSESYQLLVPKAKHSFGQLEPIDETRPIGNHDDFDKNLESMSKIEISTQMNNNSGQITSDGSSSMVSLPMSPELSVVENISISKDVLNDIGDYPILNEIQSNDVKVTGNCNKYMISDVDVSVPLMQQNCGFESCNTGTSEASSSDPRSVVTESLLSKIGTIKIDEQVTVTSLDRKLHDLLLESAKKMSITENGHNKESMMDVDVTNINTQKREKSKKRCSTPRKRKGSQKSIPPKVAPVVEEEHVEYSHSGRMSCPPQFQTFGLKVNEEMNIANQTRVLEKPKARKKKDIIKVKIQRPIAKKSREKRNTKSGNESKTTVTDSGINDTESSVFLPIDDSIDLIHNHSETCLHATECIGDSVEFVDNSKSVITLGDSMQSGDNLWNSQCECNDFVTPDLFCNNAQDMKSFYNKSNTDVMESSDTVYHSPLGTEASHNSLMTDDLSDDLPPSRPTKWYLLSEDETTNTNMAGQRSPMLNGGGFISNLKQLFPITCAVPDLSTITEMSKENEDSRKPTLELDGITGDDFNSQSIFDSNF